MIDIIVVIAVILIIIYFAGKNIEDARKYDNDPIIDEIYRDYEAKLYPKKEKTSSSGSKKYTRYSRAREKRRLQ